MAPTSDERREVAARLREAVVDDGHIGKPYGEQGFQVTLRRIIGTSNPSRPTLYARLADLIDPTCEIKDDNRWTSDFAYVCRACGEHFSTCNQPRFCPHCGARVTSGGEG